MRVLRIYHSGVVSSWRERDREMRAGGVDLTLITARRWNEGGADIACEPGDEDFVIPVRTLGRHPYRFVYNPIPIWRALRVRNIDVIDVHEEPGSVAHAEIRLLSRLSGNRRVPMTFYGAQNIEKRYPPPFRWFEHGAFRRCAVAYPCNDEAGAIFGRKGFRGRIEVMGLGVDVARFSPDTRDEPHAVARVGFVGRLEEHKGVQVVIDALSGSKHELHVFGDGPLASQLEVQANGSGVNATFHGFTSQDQLTEAYRHLDVLVVPSQTRPNWVEQFGRVVIEAMASGVPVIVSDSGSLPEVVGDAGVVIPEADVAAWRRSIDDVVSEPERWNALRAGGFRRARTYTWTAIARRHVEMYQRLVAPVEERRYRVVYLGHTASLSGAELALARMLPALDRVDATVILGDDGPLVDKLTAAGATVEVMPLEPTVRELRKHNVRLRRFPWRQATSTVTYSFRLASRLRQLHPDVVHTNTLKAGVYGGLAGRLAGVPVIWHVRDRISDDYLPAGTARMVRRMARTVPAGLICNSASTLATLGATRRPTVVVASAVDTTIVRSARPFDGPVTRVGMVGRLARWKGQDVFLRAFAQAFADPSVTAVVIGSAMFGEEGFDDELRRLATSLGVDDRVEFAGFVDDIATEVSGLDLLVHASVIPEPFGQVIIEGMAAGVPVIATRGGGPGEIITHGVDGWLVPPGDAVALADAMRALSDDGPLRRRLADAGLTRSRDFDPSVVAAQVTAFYDRVIGHG